MKTIQIKVSEDKKYNSVFVSLKEIELAWEQYMKSSFDLQFDKNEDNKKKFIESASNLIGLIFIDLENKGIEKIEISR